jgi:serine/threonine protein phosphatase PrpC
LSSSNTVTCRRKAAQSTKNSASPAPLLRKARLSASLGLLGSSKKKQEEKAIARRRSSDGSVVVLVGGHGEASLESRIDSVLVLLDDSVLDRIVDARKEIARLKIMAAKLIRGGRGVHIVSGSITRDECEAQVVTNLEGNAFTSVAARSVSTYPMGPCGKVRDGSPICDSYLARFQGNTAILCVADGCGWGVRSREASMKAKCGFVEYVDQNVTKCTTAADVSKVLVRAVAAAHCKIMEGKSESNSAGTTTLLGGYVAPLKDVSGCAFVLVSIGDCKVYLRKSEKDQVIDLVCDCRAASFDAKDPGGRIGSHNQDGAPDLRNLTINSCVCERGDMLILVTDGVSDNFDPGLLGVNVDGFTVQTRNAWSCDKVREVLSGTEDAQSVVETLLGHCVAVTQPSRDWHESGSTGKLPQDYRKCPGKMDHCTCLCIQF